MAVSSVDLFGVNTTDAQFRDWGSSLSAQLAALGLVQTGDTGQINWTTVTRPLAVNTFQGYEIWRFNDALQATAPMFLKIEYGSGNAAASAPGLRIQIGSSSNGTGTIGGQLSCQARINSNSSSAATPYACKFSGATNRIAVAMFITDLSNSMPFFFSIERSKDTSGNDTGEAFIFQWGAVFNQNITGPNASGVIWTQWVPASGAIPVQARCSVPVNENTSVDGADYIVYAPALAFPRLKNPGRNLLAYRANDLAPAFQVLAGTIYGVSQTFLTLGSVWLSYVNGVTSASGALLMRWE